VLDAASLSATYNGLAHAATAQAPGATGTSSFTITYDNATAAPTDYKAGGYAVRAVLLNDNYAGETMGTLTIGQAALTVTTASKAKTYGRTFSPADYSGSLSGNVAADHLSIAGYASAGAASATVAGGPYAITATLSDTDTACLTTA
jgi:hypothetical protein